MVGMSMPGQVALVLAVVLLAGLLAWAWADGGREPLREIAVPVAVPEASR